MSGYMSPFFLILFFFGHEAFSFLFFFLPEWSWIPPQFFSFFCPLFWLHHLQQKGSAFNNILHER